MGNNISVSELLADWDSTSPSAARSVFQVGPAMTSLIKTQMDRCVGGRLWENGKLSAGSESLWGGMCSQTTWMLFTQTRGGWTGLRQTANDAPKTSWSIHAQFEPDPNNRLAIEIISLLQQVGCPRVRIWGPKHQQESFDIEESPAQILAQLTPYSNHSPDNCHPLRQREAAQPLTDDHALHAAETGAINPA